MKQRLMLDSVDSDWTVPMDSKPFWRWLLGMDVGDRLTGVFHKDLVAYCKLNKGTHFIHEKDVQCLKYTYSHYYYCKYKGIKM